MTHIVIHTAWLRCMVCAACMMAHVMAWPPPRGPLTPYLGSRGGGDDALRVGKRAAVSFVNHGFWLNRLNYFLNGSRTRNEVYPEAWHERSPANPFNLQDFEKFCQVAGIAIHRRIHLAGDWRKPCHLLPNLRAGCAIYELGRG